MRETKTKCNGLGFVELKAVKRFDLSVGLKSVLPQLCYEYDRFSPGYHKFNLISVLCNSAVAVAMTASIINLMS